MLYVEAGLDTSQYHENGGEIRWICCDLLFIIKIVFLLQKFS